MKEIPALRRLALGAQRLHPRPAAAATSLAATKLGGMILWPDEDPWPVCEDPYLGGAPHHVHLEPLLQLRRDDFPAIPFPGKTDLLQLLWCPYQHMDEGGGAMEPGYHLSWRRESEVRTPRHLPPAIEAPPFDQRLRECQFHVEDYTDYPHYFDLDDRTRARINRWKPPPAEGDLWAKARQQRERLLSEIVRENWIADLPDCAPEVLDALRGAVSDGALTYNQWIGAAPGTKMFGYPNWVQFSAWDEAQCSRGHQMDYILQIDTGEFGPDGDQRWCPLEDQAAYRAQADHSWDSPLQSPHGVLIGDAGRLFLFVCSKCKDRPGLVFFQCS